MLLPRLRRHHIRASSASLALLRLAGLDAVRCTNRIPQGRALRTVAGTAVAAVVLDCGCPGAQEEAEAAEEKTADRHQESRSRVATLGVEQFLSKCGKEN